MRPGFEAAAVQARAALLRCAQDGGGRDGSPLQDQLDCAALVLLAGHPDSARAIYDAAFLGMGFSGGCLRRQAEVADRTGLWRNAPLQPPAPPAGLPANAVDAAVAGLRQVMAEAGDLPPLPSSAAAPTAADWPDTAGDGPPGIPPGAPEAAPLCARLHEALQRPAGPPARGRLGALLSELRRDVLGRPALDVRTQADAHLPPLAEGVASVLLRRFLLRTWDLAHPPFGSPGLLHAAAQVEAAGLGPYFSAVPRLARGSRDLLALIQLAAGTRDRDTLERWAVLLSAHLDAAALNDLAHELADLGLMRALWGILGRVRRDADGGPDLQPRRPPDIGLLWTLRDAGLDNGDLALAVQAQREVVRWSPRNATECLVLGEIEATAGHDREAGASFQAAIRHAPSRRDAQERAQALRAGEFEAFHVRAGFGTPRSRRLVRERRRAAEQAAG